jgi:hypothetical protein
MELLAAGRGRGRLLGREEELGEGALCGGDGWRGGAGKAHLGHAADGDGQQGQI